jgi:hypothetical protein
MVLPPSSLTSRPPVFRDSDSNAATPHFAFRRDEADHEMFVLAARFGRLICQMAGSRDGAIGAARDPCEKLLPAGLPPTTAPQPVLAESSAALVFFKCWDD